MIQRDDGALGLGVGRGLCGDALQPEAGRCHQSEKRSAMLGGKSDDLIRNASDHGQQGDANPEARPECGHRNQRVHHDRDDHHGHQEAGAATRMVGRIFLHGSRRQRIAVLKGINRLVLRAVIFVDAVNIAPQRYSPDKSRNRAIRITPSTRLKMICWPNKGFTRFSSVAATSGRNLYMKMKKPTEMTMLTVAIQPVTSSFFLSAAGSGCSSSRATLAENFKARKPSVIA